MARKLPVVGAILIGGLFIAERRWPLASEPRARQRLLINAALGLLAIGCTWLVEAPAAALASRGVERRRWGLSRLARGPLRTTLGLLWLDWTLYLWHRAAHLWPPLWRFHLPHHLDPALDTTTAWRFHPLELLASVPVRVLQVAVAGVPRDALQLWRELLLMSISFHHSNLRLPAALERQLGLFIMTPRLHRVHHAASRSRRNSNWSSGLTLWDRLHGTYGAADDAESLRVGVEGQAPAPELGSESKDGNPADPN